MATMSGLRLYTSFGFEITEHAQIPMPDGTSIAFPAEAAASAEEAGASSPSGTMIRSLENSGVSLSLIDRGQPSRRTGPQAAIGRRR